MRGQRRSFTARGSAQEHLVSGVHQLGDFAAQQEAGFTDPHLAAAEVRDHRAAAVSSHSATAAGFGRAGKSKLLKLGDALFKRVRLRSLIAKEHRSLIIS